MKMTLAFSMLFFAACATMTRGPNETIAVDSQPRGAAASISCDGGVNVSGTTPAKLVIPRKVDGCVVEVSGNGHTKRVTLHRGFSGRYWSNFTWLSAVPIAGVLSIGGDDNKLIDIGAAAGVGLTALGFIVDSVSGSMYDRDVHDVFADLEP
jgi:hypothetical protein